jgi:geranylgeranyl pyrophosphate synthase
MRQFKGRRDIDLGLECALKTGIDKTKHLALLHLKKALEALESVPSECYSHSVLASLGQVVYSRTK